MMMLWSNEETFNTIIKNLSIDHVHSTPTSKPLVTLDDAETAVLDAVESYHKFLLKQGKLRKKEMEAEEVEEWIMEWTKQ